MQLPYAHCSLTSHPAVAAAAVDGLWPGLSQVNAEVLLSDLVQHVEVVVGQMVAGHGGGDANLLQVVRLHEGGGVALPAQEEEEEREERVRGFRTGFLEG